MKRRALQVIVVAVGCILLGRFGLPGLVAGAGWVAGDGAITPLMDSEVRFLSALAIGLAAILFWMVPRIEKETVLFRIILAATFVGGLARLLSYVQVGSPPSRALVAMVIEIVVPLVCLFWQNSVALDHRRPHPSPRP